MRHRIRITVTALILAAGALSPGCVYTNWTGTDGRSLTRISLFGNQSVGEVNMIEGTMKGYTSEQAQVAGAVAAGVAKALVKP